MSNNLQNLPALGNAISGQNSDGTLKNEEFLGGTRVFQHFNNYGTSSPQLRRSGHEIKAILLRNTSGGALLGGNLARLNDAAVANGSDDRDDLITEAEGYVTAAYHRSCVLIDPWLPTAGVPDDDLFWGIICGPAPGRSPQDAANANGDAATNDIAYSAADTLGRITIAGTPADATTARDQALAALGTYMEACADASVDTDTWIMWNMPWIS